MRYISLLIMLFCLACSTRESEKHFVSFVYDLRFKRDSAEFHRWVIDNVVGKKSENYECGDSLKINNWSWAHCFYQNDSYSVLGECRGEFGGSIVFVDRKAPDKGYYLPTLCPQMVEKRDDGFYITESLSHMTGFGRVVKIKDPKELVMVDLSLPLKDGGFIGIDRFEAYKNQAIRRPVQTLIDTIEYTFPLFFQFDKMDYVIYSGNGSMYLGKVERGHIQVLDTLTRLRTWDDATIHGEIVDGIYHNHYEWEYEDSGIISYSSGDIYVKQDTIVIGYIAS